MKLFSTLIKSTLAIALVAVLSPAQSQSPVDIGLRSVGDRLEVVLRPGTDFSGIVSSLVFTIRWERSTGVGLGEIEQEGVPLQFLPVQRSGEVHQVGAYEYQVFAGFGIRPMHTVSTAWSAAKEYVIATIPVQGDATFELVNDAWTGEPTNNADYYLALGGSDRTGVIYKGVAAATGDGSILIHPNPNKGQFNVSVEITEAVDLTVEVLNALGQSVFQDEVRKFLGTYSRDMDISGMSSGVYLLKVGRGDAVTTHKIIYNK